MLPVRVLIVLLILSGVGVAQATPFFDFWGYSYLEGPPFSVGTTTFVPMRFDPVQPELVIPLDLENNEYTVFIQDLLIVEVVAAGPVRTITYAGGDIQIFEDGAKNSGWTVNPPNGTVPGRFVDGELILAGHFTECAMVYLTTTMTGTVQGHVNWTSGSRLGELPAVDGWLFFGGTTDNPMHDTPDGYDMGWDPQLLPPEATASERTTWGKVRGLFR